ncbi:MAG: hypothetical protein EXX96DRAFT_479448, partial [Benjaminiella poitrasii]
SNTLPEVDDITGKRPDYIVDVYERYQYAYSSCFGEIKIEKANDTLKVLDFYHLAIFGRNAVENHNLNGIICFQTIGNGHTVLEMSLFTLILCSCYLGSLVIFYYMLSYIVSIITHLDGMLSLVCLHELVELASSYPLILPYMYVQNERKSLTKKREPSLTSISSSSKP